MERIYTNKKFKRFIGILLAVIILFNVATPSIITPKAEAVDIGGILLLPLTYLISMLAKVAQDIIDTAFSMPGMPAGITGDEHLFISDIVYNKIQAFKINIFSSTEMQEVDGKSPLINTMLPEIQKWYGYTRVLAIAAALVMLIYVAIQIFITTAAGDKAKYKQLLKDWALSLLLVFTMHFIMAGILYACDAITGVFAAAGSDISAFELLDAKIDELNAFGLIYAMLKWVFLILTLAFVLIYTKRVIMIAFLTIIAPLVAISYSIDKIKDGKSQILDKWMKEYIYNALTMPMDALLFTVLSGVLAANLVDGGNIIFAVALVVGYLPLRGWFNEFLGTDKTSHGMKGAAAGAAIGSMLAMKGKGGKGGNASAEGGDGTGGNAEAEKEKIQANKAGGGSGGSLGPGSEPAGHGLPQAGNPALSGGGEERVSEPVSAAASPLSSGGASGSISSGNAPGFGARLGRVAGIAGKSLGKTASRAATGAVSGTLGLMTMAATGNVTAGLGTMVAAQKGFNSGNEYGLGGKIASGARDKYDSVAGAASYVANGGIVGDEPITAESLKDAGALNDARSIYGKDNIKQLKDEGFEEHEINQVVAANMQEKVDNMSFREMNKAKRTANKTARKEIGSSNVQKGSNEAQAIRAKQQLKAASSVVRKNNSKSKK